MSDINELKQATPTWLIWLACLAFAALRASGAFAAGAVSARSAPPTELSISVGNLSVPLLLAQWGSPLIAQGVDVSLAAHRRETAALLNEADDVDAHAIEDYLGWAVVEPKRGQWDWSSYQDNAKAITARGFQYIPFVWMQNLPAWARHNTRYPRARCVEHGLESEALSIFSAKTLALYDRFFARMAREFGAPIALMRIGAPNDFGETSYPVGAATFAFPDRHIHPGFWVDEPDARAHFARSMRAKYLNTARLNAAWGTTYTSFDTLSYPLAATQRRRWLDFVNWYHDAHTERMAAILAVVRRHFPDTALKLSLGFPDERISYGQDISGVVKLVSERGQQLRTPTGAGVPFFYSKRVATAARFYRLNGFSSEPQDGEASVEALATAAFKDLTTAVTLHFDYPTNLKRARATFESERRQWQNSYPEIDTALFFSTTAHRLDDRSLDAGFPGYPDRLVPFTQSLRDILDYDVLDERLLNDGALSNYRVLVWPFGFITEAATLTRLRAWVESGGVLVVGKLADVTTVEGDRGAFAQIPTGSTFKLGNGTIFDANGELDELAAIVATRRYVETGAISAATLLPPLDRAVDGVLLSQFADGLVLYNTTGAAVTKNLSMPPGDWRVSYRGLAPQVTLGPLEIMQLDATIDAD